MKSALGGYVLVAVKLAVSGAIIDMNYSLGTTTDCCHLNNAELNRGSPLLLPLIANSH